jgi:hypothetical protein
MAEETQRKNGFYISPCFFLCETLCLCGYFSFSVLQCLESTCAGLKFATNGDIEFGVNIREHFNRP